MPVVVAAIRQQRHAAAVIGRDTDLLELDKRLRAAQSQDATGEAVLLRGDPSELPRLLAEQAGPFLRRHHHLPQGVGVHPGGSVDLIVLFLPAALLLRPRPKRNGRSQASLGAVDLLTAAAIVLRPGGYLVAVTNDELHRAGRDPGSETVSLCEELALRYWQHIVCLLVPIDGDQLRPPQPGRQRHGVKSPTESRVVHQNVHVFRKPTASEALADSQMIASRRAA